MNKKEIIAGLLKTISERNYNVSSFNQRLLAQKIMYIIQEVFGIDFGYDFNLYLRGPYSPKFTNEFYEIKNTVNFEELEFDDPEKNNLLLNLKEIISNYSSDVGIMELSSTLLYLYQKNHSQQAIKLMKKIKQGFSKEKYDLAINIVNRLNEIKR